MKGETKLPGIQVTRAVAALSVVYFHSYIAITYFDPAFLLPQPHLAKHGAAGVDLFFAVSGFIVCYVASNPDFTAGSFLIKRFFRIYRLNAFVTLAILALFHIGGVGLINATESTLGGTIASLLIFPQSKPINSVGWTLEYEITFYIIAAVLLPLGGPRLLLAYCIVSVLGWMVWKPELPWIARFVSEKYATFGVGVVGFLVLPYLLQRDNGVNLLLALAFASVSLLLYRTAVRDPFLFSTSVAVGIAVIAAALLPYAPRWLVVIGDASYGIYLYHWPMMHLSTYAAWVHFQPPKQLGELWRWGTIGLIILVALASWYGAERAINRFGRRVAGGRPSLLPAPVPG